jgi:CelD/BcsL family acetyltransferase involved in cellulose biosynthesis
MQPESVARPPKELTGGPLAAEEPASAPANGRLIVRFLKSTEELLALAPALDALVDRSADRSASFRASYLLAAWHGVAATQRTNQLRVLTIEEAGELVAVWPLYLDEAKRVVRHLGCGCNEEYAGLLQAAPARRDLAELALSTIMPEADLLEVFSLRAGDPLGDAIARRTFHYRGDVHSPVVQTAGYASGDAWRKSKSKSFRQGIRNARNRLEKELGTVATGLVDADRDAFVDWLFAQKREWIAARGIKDSWIDRAASPAFFKVLLAQPSSGVVGFAVKAGGGRLVAGAILFLSNDVEYFITTHDPAFARFSPGQLILDGVVDLTCARGANLDLRITLDDYKLRLTETIEDRYTYRVALKPGGRNAVRLARLRRVIRKARVSVGKGRRWLHRRLRRK